MISSEVCHDITVGPQPSQPLMSSYYRYIRYIHYIRYLKLPSLSPLGLKRKYEIQGSDLGRQL